MRIAGVDPGVTGALCLVRSGEGRSNFPQLDVIDIPTKEVGKRREIDCRAFRDLLRAWKPDYLYFENVHAFVGQGVVAAGVFMRSVGMLEAICACEVDNCVLVVPPVWKRRFDLLKTGKAEAIELVSDLFPKSAHYFARKKDHNRADAALIAIYGAERIGLLNLENE